MKLTAVFFVAIVLAVLTGDGHAGKIPVRAIQKAGKAIGNTLRAINVASTLHDIAKAFQPKPRNHKENINTLGKFLQGAAVVSAVQQGYQNTRPGTKHKAVPKH